MLDRQRVRDLFAEALALPPEEARAWLARACGGDAELEKEVQSLLDSGARRPRFLGAPTAAHAGAAAAQPGEALGTVLGHYRLEQEIGEGGFGIVYIAEQLEPVKRKVALKLIKLGMDTRAVIARFEAERQALAMMDHANIARVFDAGATASGRPYFVMELVRGEPITAYCDRSNLTIADRLELFVQVCHAVQHAHSKGVIHRDIKPSNVLVTTEDGRPLAKVIDFGIAKATQRSETDKTAFTEHRQLVGTPEYMSPEQAEGSPNIDTRTDVYGLGVLLYELLTGATPFDGKTLRSAAYAEIQRIIREVEPPKPSTRVSTLGDTITSVASQRRTAPGRLSPMLRGDLDWIVMRCLEKDRSRRYATSDALAADLHAYLRGDPVSAVPPSAAYRARKFVGRHRGLVATTAIVVAALVLGLIGTGIGLQAATRSRAEAQASAERASREAEQARAINEFMREVLTSVEPQKSGADVRLMEVMSGASGHASQRFAELPLMEAQVQDLLAAVYSKIGQFALAKSAAERSAALFRTHAGADDPRTLRAESLVIGSALNLSRTDEADRLIAALLPRAEKLLGPDDITTLMIRRALATVHMMRGRTDEAERLLLALRAHPRLAQDDRLQSLIIYSLCRIRQQRALAQDPAARQENWRQTLELTRECVERSILGSGPNSADAFRARSIFAQALCDIGSVREAAELSRTLLTESEGRFEPCHINRRNVMSVLADSLAALGDFDEPASLYTRLIECSRSIDASNPIVLVSNIGDSLKYFERSGRAAEGEALAREGLTLMQGFGAAHANATTNFELYLARFASMAGRFDEAEARFSPMLAKEQSFPGVQFRTRLHLFYARHLLGASRFDEAEQFLLRAEQIRGTGVAGSRDRVADEVLCGFIALYQAWHRPDKLAEYERRRQVESGIPAQR